MESVFLFVIHIKKKIFMKNQIVLAILAAFSSAVYAQTETLPTIVVGASPIIEEVRVDPFSSVSAVVTEEQLRDQNAIDLTAALRRVPGVQTSRYNPVGAFGGSEGGGVFIRGMGTSRPGSEIKTYIDGVPFYMGIWSHPLLDLLPINGMQSITVIKSPQPQISGDNFASVNLETKRASEEGVHGDFRVSAGSFGTVAEQATLLGRHGDLDWMLAQGFARSDGHRSNANGKLSNVMGRIGIRLNDNWSTSTSFLYVDNKSRDPGSTLVAASAIPQQFNTEGGTISAEIAHTHQDWRGSLKVFGAQAKGSWLNQPAPDGDTISKSKMVGLRWKEQFSPWTGGTIIAGLDYDKISGDAQFNRVPPAANARFDIPTFKITSPYVALNHNITLNKDWSLLPSLGLRFYHSNHFPSKTAPHAGVSLISDKLTIFANVSRGVHYPGPEAATLSFNIAALGRSWEQLSAEELNHAEIGFKFSPTASTQIDASLFNDRVKNRYVFGFPPNVSPPPKFLNLGSYRVKGAELAIRQEVTSNWTVFGGLTLLDPSISRLPYTPRRAFTLGINGKVGPVRVAFDAQHQSETWALSSSRTVGSVPKDTQKVDAFTVANMRLSYPIPALGKKGEVFLAVENIFDAKYAYRTGYPMPGRWGQVGLSASF
ncbi:MAG: TonB-dependent receptor [Brachymonas sp.]